MLNADKYYDSIKTAETIEEEQDCIRITDPVIIDQFERSTKKELGIVDNQPFFNVRMDLYSMNGRLFRYCSIECGKSGAAALLVIQGEQKYFVLNRQYRPIVHRVMYEIPRGFAAGDDKTPVDTVLRELREETNVDLSKQKYEISELGSVTPDSGLTNAHVMLYLVELQIHSDLELKVNDTEEPILGHMIVSEGEFLRMLADGRITDAFSMAAYLMYKNRKEAEEDDPDSQGNERTADQG